MLGHYRRYAETVLMRAESVTVATNGPAGLQMGKFPCCAAGQAIYLVIPETSEQLVNLELDCEVVMACDHWQLRGEAKLVSIQQAPQTVAQSLLQGSEARWSKLVMVQPRRLQLFGEAGRGFRETIDF